MIPQPSVTAPLSSSQTRRKTGSAKLKKKKGGGAINLCPEAQREYPSSSLARIYVEGEIQEGFTAEVVTEQVLKRKDNLPVTEVGWRKGRLEEWEKQPYPETSEGNKTVVHLRSCTKY